MDRRSFLRATTAAAALAPLAPVRSLALTRVTTGTASARDLDAVRVDGKSVTLSADAVKALASRLRGPVLLSDSPGYDDARRLLNPSFDLHPALIVQPTGPTDVRRAVEFAATHQLLTAVKCGGHSFGGKSSCERGLQIDLSKYLRGVRVDRAARRAWVAGGTLLGEVDRETNAVDLVTPLGTVSHTGVGGLTTGGGFGRLARKFGLAADNVVSVDVVTADGNLVHADRDTHPDLYWGVRGGGGNFGIVTGFEFQLHERPRQILAGDVVFPIARAGDVLRFFNEFHDNAPDELYIDFHVVQPPGGAPGAALLSIVYCGEHADRDLAPLAKLGTPLENTIGPKDYVDVQRSGDISDPRAMGIYLKSGFITDVSEQLITATVDGFTGDPARTTIVFTQASGGAISRVAPDACAFPNRYARHTLMHVVAWPMGTDSAPHIAYARKYWSTLEPMTKGFYTNEVQDESRTVLDSNYGPNLTRLRQVKKQYDPTNLFRLNANVLPA